MKIRFSSTNPSSAIKEFTTVEKMPDFVVLTGLNGSGKTHLLKAIETGLVKVDEIDHTDINYYSYLNFRFFSDSIMNDSQLKSQQKDAWSFMGGTSTVNGLKINIKNLSEKAYIESFISNESGSKDQTDSIIDYYLTEVEEKKLNLWSNLDNHVNKNIRSRIEKYQHLVRDKIFKNPAYRQRSINQAVTAAVKAIGKPIHLITEEELSAVYIPSSNQNDFLSTSIGSVFTAYKIQQYRHYHDEWEKSGYQATRDVLEATFDSKLRKPWDLMNELLEKIRSHSGNKAVFDFSITNPGDEVLKSESVTDYTFSPQLIDNKNGEFREFKLLSSGEQVLLALTVAIFEDQRGFEFPKIILLDEVDATLHPSMIRALIRTIKDVFVNRGTKVIVATHSPTTVALAEENEVYVVNPGPVLNKIEPVTRAQAMSMITEGFITFESGFSVFNEVSSHDICIITEGKNSQIIRRALEILGEDEVVVVSGAESCSGKNQLKTLYDFFKAVSHHTKVLFLVDVDVSINSWEAEGKNTFRLRLPRNEENTLAKPGIENIFPEELVEPFSSEIVKRGFDREEVLEKKIDENRKSEFADYVVSNGTKEDFNKFSCLKSKLAEIRKS